MDELFAGVVATSDTPPRKRFNARAGVGAGAAGGGGGGGGAEGLPSDQPTLATSLEHKVVHERVPRRRGLSREITLRPGHWRAEAAGQIASRSAGSAPPGKSDISRGGAASSLVRFRWYSDTSSERRSDFWKQRTLDARRALRRARSVGGGGAHGGRRPYHRRLRR